MADTLLLVLARLIVLAGALSRIGDSYGSGPSRNRAVSIRQRRSGVRGIDVIVPKGGRTSVRSTPILGGVEVKHSKENG